MAFGTDCFMRMRPAVHPTGTYLKKRDTFGAVWG